MSETLTQMKTPLWKPGTKSNNIEFLSSFKRLEKEDFQTYQIIDQKEGYVCQDHNYEYRVGKSQYGLWASRRKLGLDGLKQIEDKPPARPPMNDNVDEIAELKKHNITLEARVSKLERIIKCIVDGYQQQT
ncbi:MAG TPA: hypothetical protein VIR31_06425 [Nitrososphaeraceae archaeon]